MPPERTHLSGCPLLVSIPLDRAAFDLAWQRGSDFLRGMSDDRETCWRAYQPTAEYARRVFQEAEKMGARVVRNATSKASGDLSGDIEALTILCHMDFPLIQEQDVRDWKKLSAYLGASSHPELDAFRKAGSAEEFVQISNALISQTLEALCTVGVTKPGAADVWRRQHPNWEQNLVRPSRPLLDVLLGEQLLSPGKGIEMADGFLSAAEFDQILPRGFQGVLDLRMCNSLTLAMALKRIRPGLRVAAASERIRPEGPLTLWLRALHRMRERRESGNALSYIDAMREAVEAHR